MADLNRWLSDWTATARTAGAVAAPARLEAAGADLLQRWQEPHRRYHDLAHLIAVLTALDELDDEAHGPALTDGERAAVRLAAWFHDAVYQGRPGADERASADLAEQVLTGLELPARHVDLVARLVRVTANHDPAADDAAGALLVDADLAVLAGEPAAYARYAGAVRAEYAHVPEAAFRAGRAAVLRALLAAPSLYRTAAGRRRWEQAARANLTREIAELTAEPGRR